MRSFVIRGNESFETDTIKEGLATRIDPGWRASIPWFPLLGAEHSYFNYLDWRKDLKRIRTFYEARGYYDVQITREQIQRHPEEGVVDLLIAIDEGTPVRLEGISIEGLAGVPDFEPETLVQKIPLESGAIFTEEDYTTSKDRLRKRLERAGYPYVELDGRATVRPEQQTAHVHFVVDPGPKASIGDVHIRGLDTIPESYVRRAIDLEKGQPYSSRALQDAQQDVYGLDVFSFVNVVPEREAVQTREESEAGSAETPRGALPNDTSSSDADASGGGPSDRSNSKPPGPLGISTLLASAQKRAEERAKLPPTVPIAVRVKEARMWNVRVGTGFTIEKNRQDVHGQLDISSRNFFGGLRKLQFSNKAGFAWAPGVLFTTEEERERLTPEGPKRGPILKSELRFVQPWFWGGGRTNFNVVPSIERDVQREYKFWNPALRLGIDRTFFDSLTIGIGYQLSYYNFDDFDPELTETTPLGRDFQEEFRLGAFDQRISFDRRNNPLNPERGFLTEFSITEATQNPFGDFRFLKIVLSGQGYVPFTLGTKWVLATRAQFGTIYNLLPQEGRDTLRVPTTQRFYSGGKGSMRSFGNRDLTIYRESSRVGGLTQAEAAFETRFRLVSNLAGVGDFWGATFIDTATVLDGELLNDDGGAEAVEPAELFETLIPGVGVGIWWVTPVGPIRFDFAYTLPTGRFDRVFEPEGLSRFNFILSIGQSL